MTWKDWIGTYNSPYELPPNLERILAVVDPDRIELTAFDQARFAVILQDMLRRAARSVMEFGPPAYHNGQHFVEVVENVLLLLHARVDPVPEAVRQALVFAAAGHDFAHPGATYRKDAVNGRPLPELGDEMATEEVSARIVDDLAHEYAFNPAARLFIFRAIGATTFGNPAIGPQSPLERILACADVAPNDPFLVWYKKGVDVTFHECPAKPAPTTFSGWLKNRLGFIDYYLVNFFDEGKLQYYTQEAFALGWGMTLLSYKITLMSVEGGQDPMLAAMLKSMLPADRVDLSA